MNKELERITKYDKKIKDVEKALLTSISMEPFMNYEGIENDRTLSTVQKIVLYQKAIDDKKRRHIYFATNHGKLLEKCFIQGRNIYKKNSKRKWPKQAMGSVLAKARKAYIVLSTLNLSEGISASYEEYVNTIQTNGNNTWTIRTVDLC